MRSYWVLGVALMTLMPAASAQKKKLLFIGESQGFQHDSVSYAAGTIWKLGQESGLWDTYIRTDSQLITRRALEGNAKNLDFFDAVFFYTSGSLAMDASQKADLLAFVRDDGKGFLGCHSATDTFYDWPEYGDLIGAYFDGHPWGAFDARINVEDRGFPATAHFPEQINVVDEIYQFRAPYSRGNLRVLMSLDAGTLDFSVPGVNRADRDFAVTWTHQYGNGRVFYSSLGHLEQVWDRPDIQKMWVEAIKWAMGITK